VVGLDLPPLTISLTAEPSLTAAAFQRAQHLFVPDVPGHPGVSVRVQRALDIASAAWQPVLAHGSEAVGVFGLVWHRRVDVLPAHVPAMLQTLAAEAAHAIERGDLLARLAVAADRDTLTGLANRRRWDETADAEVARATRTGRPLTFALLDLDHFKRYNDTLGHLAGDGLLRDFATAALACLRNVDTLARWGGEEFALALPGCPADEAVAVADRIRAIVPQGQTCTIGIAPWRPGLSAGDALAAADAALYRGKENGRNTTVLAEAPVTSA
jgi:diguanylate cyclase (GGDEF)-like protein